MEPRGHTALVWSVHTIEEALSLLEGPWSLIPAGGVVPYSPAWGLLICSSGSLVAALGLQDGDTVKISRPFQGHTPGPHLFLFPC